MSRHGIHGIVSIISRHANHAVHGDNDTVIDAQNPTGSERGVTYHDLTIQFIGANGIPKMDVVGSADPYFIADLDGCISIV